MFLICLIYLFCFYGSLTRVLNCDKFVLAAGGGFGGRLLIDFYVGLLSMIIIIFVWIWKISRGVIDIFFTDGDME